MSELLHMTTEIQGLTTHVETTPIKGKELECVDLSLLEAQAEIARECLVDIDYYNTNGTCGDERARVGYADGTEGSEVRPSVFGGPNIYGLAISEMTGQIPATITSGEEALVRVTRSLNAAGIKSGGHEKCAANAGLAGWMETVAESPDAVASYVAKELEDRYDETLMAQVTANTRAALASGRYDGWSEDILVRVLGTEAGKAIEKLIDAPHEGYVIEKQKIEGKTIDQTALYYKSQLGKGSFDVDYPYAEIIEGIVTSGPDAAQSMLLAEHAREAIHAAIAGAVPNAQLYQDIIM